jgi:hypothetical protein
MSAYWRAREPKDIQRAERLKRLRSVMGYGEHGGLNRWAAELKIMPQRWGNIEKSGKLSRDVAHCITGRFPEITSDWLYDGNTRGLTPAWLEKLEPVPLQEDVEPESPSSVEQQRAANPPQRHTPFHDAARLAQADARATLAEQRLADVKQMLEEIRADRDRWQKESDAWRDQAQRLLGRPQDEC